jgi:uncharacterized protein
MTAQETRGTVHPAECPERVRVLARKWPDRPHWEFDALRLGEDAHGTWIGSPAGTPFSRPGAAFVSDQDLVTLVPREAPFMATFYAPGGVSHCDVYVDITTPAVWRDGTVTAVDLDLDVVRGWTGRVWVDDEDEFADHRVRFAYPSDVVRMAARSCEAVHAAVVQGRAPYDGTARAWLRTLVTVVRGNP